MGSLRPSGSPTGPVRRPLGVGCGQVMAGAYTVGRVAGRALLGEAMAGIAAGLGRALLIEGEPGVGKSALLDAALGAADGRACVVLRGSCDELGRQLPLSVMARVLGLDERSQEQRQARAAAASTPDPVMAAVEQLRAVVDRLCEERPVGTGPAPRAGGPAAAGRR